MARVPLETSRTWNVGIEEHRGTTGRRRHASRRTTAPPFQGADHICGSVCAHDPRSHESLLCEEHYFSVPFTAFRRRPRYRRTAFRSNSPAVTPESTAIG